jgi:nucleoside-diphosphate-sugar epimerase
MVIGDGMLAKAFSFFKNDPEIIIFASGVSNSREINDVNFKREAQLLDDTMNQNAEKLIVYFSTCSIYDKSVKDKSYVLHKIKMEEKVKRYNKFYIFRLSQVVGETQSPTLVRVFFYSILEGEEININKFSTRNLIDVADVFTIVSCLIRNKLYINEITNIATPFNKSVLDIALMMAAIIGCELKYKLLNAGSAYDINIDKIDMFTDIFHDEYLHDLLSNYGNSLSKNNRS